MWLKIFYNEIICSCFEFSCNLPCKCFYDNVSVLFIIKQKHHCLSAWYESINDFHQTFIGWFNIHKKWFFWNYQAYNHQNDNKFSQDWAHEHGMTVEESIKYVFDLKNSVDDPRLQVYLQSNCECVKLWIINSSSLWRIEFIKLNENFSDFYAKCFYQKHGFFDQNGDFQESAVIKSLSTGDTVEITEEKLKQCIATAGDNTANAFILKLLVCLVADEV